eukprot:4555237-Prorocentrum_lima.AAC.1
MTSSLVGSEMCIRDSFGISAEMRCIPKGKLPRDSLRDALRTVKELTASVSYTHLTLPTICSV